MKNKSVQELITDAESLYNALAKVKGMASDRIKRASSYQYSAEYKQNESRAARNAYTDEKSATSIKLSKIRDRIAEAAVNEAPVLRTNAVDLNLATLLQLPLTVRDYQSLAKNHINDYTKLRMIEASAQRNGITLKAHREPEEVAHAAEAYIDRLIKTIQDDNSDLRSALPETDSVFLSESRQYVDRMLDPFTVSEIECHASDLESSIAAAIIKDRQAASAPETDEQFERGFTGRVDTPIDYGTFPALSGVVDKLAEVRLPEKSKRVLDGLWNTIDSKRLHDNKPLTAQEVKAASDIVMTSNVALGTELRELADLFLDDGTQFAAKPGFEVTAPTTSYNSKLHWDVLKRDAAALLDRETVAKNTVTIANASYKNNASRQDRREAEEQARYENLKTVDKTGENNGNLHAD